MQLFAFTLVVNVAIINLRDVEFLLRKASTVMGMLLDISSVTFQFPLSAVFVPAGTQEDV